MPPLDPRFLRVGLHTFVDESYGPDDYYVGGVVLADHQLIRLNDQLAEFRDEVCEKFDLSADDVEFHAHQMMHGKGEWACLDGQVHESVWICRRIIHIVVNCGARIHMQGVDVRRLNARYRYPDSPYRIALRHLLERVNDDCIRRELRSSVTADILDESDAATAAIRGFVRNPTPGYRPTRLTHIEPMEYVDSRASLGVQAADVVAYTLRRHLEVKNSHPRAAKAARQLFNAALPAVSTCRKWNP